MKMGKFDGILLLSDMDGTLLDNEKNISTGNLRAIQNFVSEGGLFCMATGRPPLTTSDFEAVLPQDMLRVYLNGALLRDAEGNTIEEIALRQEVWQLVKDIEAKFPQVGCEMFAADAVYLYRSSPESMQHQQMSGCSFSKFSTYTGKESLFKANFTGQPEVLEQVRRDCANSLQPYTVVSSAPIFLEVTEPKADKGKALETLRKRLNVKMACAIGDNGNDLGMIEQADFSFAPENAEAQILQAASCIVRANTHDAVAHAIEKIGQRLG